MHDVLCRLSTALRDRGILYVSFKCGTGEHIRNGRLFNDYQESEFRALIADSPGLEILDVWISPDVRPERSKETWLNALLRKVQ